MIHSEAPRGARRRGLEDREEGPVILLVESVAVAEVEEQDRLVGESDGLGVVRRVTRNGV